MLCIVTVSNNVIIACTHIQPKGVEEAFIQGLSFRLWAEVETMSRGYAIQKIRHGETVTSDQQQPDCSAVSVTLNCRVYTLIPHLVIYGTI